jgi:hypothetical protein
MLISKVERMRVCHAHNVIEARQGNTQCGADVQCMLVLPLELFYNRSFRVSFAA